MDEDGRFFHDEARVEHPGLIKAMHSWISRHPHDGRFVLENGWDWCYLTVDDAPYVVRAVNVVGPEGTSEARSPEGFASRGSESHSSALELTLSDDSVERVDPAALRVDANGVLRCDVKATKKGGPYPARFDRHAIVALGERLREEGGAYVLHLDGRDVAIARG